MKSGETSTLAEFAESKWSIVNSPWSLKLPNTNDDDGHLLELTGPQTVSVLPFLSYIFLTKKLQKEENQKEKVWTTQIQSVELYVFLP